MWVLSSSGTSQKPRSELPGLKTTTSLHERYGFIHLAWLAITTLILASINSDMMTDHLDHDTPF